MVSANLHNLVQMECLGMHTRMIRVDRGDVVGRIYVTGGQIVHAEVGGLAGQEALFEMMTWTRGAFSLEDGVRALDETITRPWENLLMEAAHYHDEKVHATSTVTLFPLPPAPMIETLDMTLFDDPEILNAVQFSVDDELLEAKGDDPEALHSAIAYASQLLVHVGAALGIEGLFEAQLIGPEKKMLCIATAAGTTAVVTSSKTNLTAISKKLS